MDRHQPGYYAATPRPDHLYSADMAGPGGEHDYEARKKQRRNRTTQSCLNCHTSKRKCDRKRPCSRCIQLGMTALCVYEIEDPAARDDPNMDELTHCRNRIAELEAILREIRGKPHPRVQSLLHQDTASNDEPYSRSGSRSSSLSSRRTDPMDGDARYIKSENSLPPSLYGAYSFDDPSDYSPISPGASTSTTGSPFTSGSSASSAHCGDISARPLCTCGSNPASLPTLTTLSLSLQNSLATLQLLPEHATSDRCLLLQNVRDLQETISTLVTDNRTPPCAASGAGPAYTHAHMSAPHPGIPVGNSLAPHAAPMHHAPAQTYHQAAPHYPGAHTWHYNAYPDAITEQGLYAKGVTPYGLHS